MSNNEVIINQKEHTDIYNWLSEYVYNYDFYQERFTLTSEGKINTDYQVHLKAHTTEIKYPFGCIIKGSFDCSLCKSLTSLIGAPEKIETYFSCMDCDKLISLIGFPKEIGEEIYFIDNKISNNPKYKEDYKLYLAMWLELLESVSNKDRKEYITNYKDKKDYNYKQSIIPIEILKEYGF